MWRGQGQRHRAGNGAGLAGLQDQGAGLLNKLHSTYDNRNAASAE